MNKPKPPSHWTDEQREAIRARGCGVLVSAAAGSGKTSVLAERCADLVCDRTHPCAVNELLVVTFTEAAASQMKQRIAQAIQERAAGGDDAYLNSQLALVEHASISTLHGFCLRLIRRHFHLLGLDASVSVIDEDQATLMRADVVRELFLERYEAGDEAFTRFIDGYGNGQDHSLMDLVVSTHGLLCSLIDPDGWMKQAIERIDKAASGTLEKSAFGEAYCQMVVQKLAGLKQSCDAARRAVPREFPKYIPYLQNLSATAEKWGAILKRDGYDALVQAVGTFEAERMPAYASDLPGKESASSLVGSVKKQFTEGSLVECLGFSSTQWRDGMKAIQPHADVFLKLVLAFGERYRMEKQAARGVDFSDLERLALRVLRDESRKQLSPSTAARQCHGLFKHVLVDEYQDINEVQDAILRLVSTECLAGDDEHSSNLFCVGDVKQSIYRFRLAEPGRFLEKEEKFREPSVGNIGRVIDLQSNFRGRKPLLEAINAVFERLMTREAGEVDYDQRHRLRAGLKYPLGDGSCFTGAPIELHLLPRPPRGAHDPEESEYDRTDIEAMLIARRIREWIGLDGVARMNVMQRAGQEMAPVPLQYGDIAILLRTTQHRARQMADILRASGVPVRTDKGGGYFDSMEVQDMLALLALLDNQRQDVPMAAVLRSPLCRLPNAEDALARVRLAYRGAAPPLPFHQAVVRYAGEKDDELAAHLRQFLGTLRRWRDLAHKRPLADLIWHIYDQSGYLAFCQGLENGDQAYANLLHLHERARQFGTFARQGLYRFLHFLESLREQTQTARPPVAAQAEDAVQIMSIHAAKGLEFPVVVVADLGKRHNLGDCQRSILVDRKEYLGLAVVDEDKQIRYPSLAQVMVRERLKRQSLAEELRLLYVSMTRAKEHLLLVGTCDDQTIDGWEKQWSGHAGPMPAQQVVSGYSMLDWVGPAACMTEGAIKITRWSAQQTRGWEADEMLRPKFSDQQEKLARLAPLEPPPKPDAAAQAIIDRLSFVYPHQQATVCQAALPVTDWAKDQIITAVGREARMDGELRLPRCVAEDLRPSAAEFGSTTHLVLQHLDFSRPCDRSDLERQLKELVARRLVSTAQAAMVDLEAIQWLVESEVGRLLRGAAGSLNREMQFYLAVPPELPGDGPSNDPMDQVMVRGRLDVVIPGEGGLILLDYKTDRISAQQVAQRASAYQNQLQLYAQAMVQITGRKIAETYLVFLGPRLALQVTV